MTINDINTPRVAKKIPVLVYEEIKDTDGLVTYTFDGYYQWFQDKGYAQLYKKYYV